MLAWNGILDRMRKHTEPEGLEYLQLWQNLVDPIDKAFKSGDLDGVAKILRGSIPHLRKLIPHLKDKNLQNSVEDAADRAEKLIEKLEADGPNMTAFDKFFESESNNMGGILGALVDTVVDLVGGLLDSLL